MKRLLILITFTYLLAGCSTGTKLTGTWKAEPSASYQFKSIAILAIAKRPEIRKAAEDEIERLLRTQGINATGALMFLPPQATKDNISREIVLEILKSSGFDGVVTISLVKREDKSRHVPGQYYYVPDYSIPFNDYYGQMSNYYYAPGYNEESSKVFLQTNLYNFPEGKLLWAAQTETTLAGYMEKEIVALAEALVNDLVKNKVIIP